MTWMSFGLRLFNVPVCSYHMKAAQGGKNGNEAVSEVLGSSPSAAIEEHRDLGQSHLTSLDLS